MGQLKAKSWFEILVLFLTEILSTKALPSTDSPSATPVDEPSVSEARKTVTWILLKSFEYIYICDGDFLGRCCLELLRELSWSEGWLTYRGNKENEKKFTFVMDALLTVNVLTSCRAVSTADTCQESESHRVRCRLF